jgi:hypothetical protein
MGLNHQQFVKDGRSRTKLYDKRDNFNFVTEQSEAVHINDGHPDHLAVEM